jgi:hypothetical protein
MCSIHRSYKFTFKIKCRFFLHFEFLIELNNEIFELLVTTRSVQLDKNKNESYSLVY